MSRKLFVYSHIPQRWAPLINDFNQQCLNPCLNFHRPCFFHETRVDPLRDMMTPCDKLKSLPRAKDYLKPGVSFEILDRIDHQISDNQVADQLQKARRILFRVPV